MTILIKISILIKILYIFGPVSAQCGTPGVGGADEKSVPVASPRPFFDPA
jgi:hypothetical protein